MEARNDSRLVRLKAVDKRRGHGLRRFTYHGITFVAGKGWSRVPKSIADYLAGVRQVDGDAHSPLAFDIATDSEARVIDESEARDAQAVRRATDNLPLQEGRGVIATADLPDASAATAVATSEERARRGGGGANRKEKE
jgi:hypothetical protein